MENQTIAIYCLCDDYFRSKKHQDWPNVKLSTAEILSIALIATRFFYGNIETARKFLCSHHYIAHTLSTSALNRRLHQLPDNWCNEMLAFIQTWSPYHAVPLKYILDAFPVSVCRNIRIARCRIYQNEDFRGYNASKKEYFYGIKVTALVTTAGCPVEVIICPGREHDSIPFKHMPLGIPEGSKIYADSAYLDYAHMDYLEAHKNIDLVAERKSNSTRPIDLEDYIGLKTYRKTIETSFATISRLLPRKIHARTQAGFELKVLGFVIALATTFVCG